MNKSIKLLLITIFYIVYSNCWAQVSPDYIFGNNNGNGWSWSTGTIGTSSLSGTYKWQFQSNATGNQYFKFGESSSSAVNSGFWIYNAGGDLQYTGNGAMWNCYYSSDIGANGAIYFAVTSGNYYIIKSRKDPSNSNCNFAIFNNGTTAPVTIASVSHSYVAPNLFVNVALNGSKGANEKIWIRYTTDRWGTSNTVEANTDLGSNVWQTSIAYTDGKIVEYYAYSTIQQNSAPAENDADFYTISYLNNSGNNYKFVRFTGTYYIGNSGTRPGGGNTDFSTLKAACDELNINGVIGACTFYICSNLTEPNDVWLGFTGTSNINTVTFKPYSGVSPTIAFTQTTLHPLTATTGLDGHFLLGSPTGTNNNTVPTNYIIFDGSNSDGGTSKDLTINGAATASQKSVFRIFGNCDHITFKNCTIVNKSSSGSTTAIFNVTNYSAANLAPDYLTINNNYLTSNSGNGANVIYCSYSGVTGNTPTIGTEGLLISNNVCFGRQRGFYISYNNQGDIFNNTITVGSEASQASGGIVLASNFPTVGTFNIFNNQLISLSTLNSTAAASNGIIGIDNQCASPKIVNIYNNFITGFATTAATCSSKVYGIRHTSSCTSNIYYNTVVFPEMTNMSDYSTSYLAGIAFATAATTEASPTGTINIKNNIIISNESTMKVWGIRRVGTSGTFNSNYNNLFDNTNSFISYYNNADVTSLANWQTATSQDANSVTKAVSFESNTDLHLNYFSQGDYNLAGTPLAEVTTDIDGNSRSSTHPYMGADENTNISLAPYKRAVDGVSTDWTGIPSSTLHATTVSNSEAIYTGENGDCRTDQSGDTPGDENNNDLNEVRYTRDDNYLYFLFKFNDLLNLNKPHIAITMDSDQSDNSPVWIGDFSGVTLNPSLNNGWERQLAIHATTNNNFSIELYADDGSQWYVPLSNYAVSHSVDNNIIEARIALYDLAINSNSNIKFTYATFDNTVGYNNAVDATTGSYVDVVTPGYSGSQNAWVRAGANNTMISNSGWVQSFTPLPVELTSFSASVIGTSVNLAWSTATEINAYSFEIERSGDNNNWSNVGSVSAHGNSSTINNYEFIDELSNAGKYYYRLKQIDNDGAFEYSNVVEVNVGVPSSYSLSQNYPNPFNPTTTINYSLPMDTRVTINIYSVTGELVKTLVNEDKSAGSYSVELNASDLASGTYFYRLIANDFVQTKKMLLIK